MRKYYKEILFILSAIIIFYCIYRVPIYIHCNHELEIESDAGTHRFKDSIRIFLRPGMHSIKGKYIETGRELQKDTLIPWTVRTQHIYFCLGLKKFEVEVDSVSVMEIIDQVDTLTFIEEKKVLPEDTLTESPEKKEDTPIEDVQEEIQEEKFKHPFRVQAHDTIPGMAYIQGGEFTMGRNDRKNREKPAHKLRIASFYMDKHEVTVKDYMAYCAETGYPKPKKPEYGWHDSLPIVNISWLEANKYAEYVGKRLPTEAEWEFAAREGLYKSGFAFSGGNGADSLAWYVVNTTGMPKKVMTKSPNRIGIYDLTGNVWEWCADWYAADYYQKAPYDNPQGPENKKRYGKYKYKFKILRGGGYGDNSYDIWTTDRRRRSPKFFYHQIGFRCVKDLD